MEDESAKHIYIAPLAIVRPMTFLAPARFSSWATASMVAPVV